MKTKTGSIINIIGSTAIFCSIIASSPAYTLAQTTASPTLYTQESCVVFGGNVGFGMRGSNVFTLQNYLQKMGYFNTEATGYFGNVTMASVKRYQADHGIDATGFVGILTRGAVRKESCGSQELSTNTSSYSASGSAVSAYSTTVNCPPGYTCTPNTTNTGTATYVPGAVNSYNTPATTQTNTNTTSGTSLTGTTQNTEETTSACEVNSVCFY